jgi:hypothetical protein
MAMSTTLYHGSTAEGAPSVPPQGRPTREELIKWVSVYGDEVDEVACRGGMAATAGPAGLASREEVIQWVSVYGDEVAWG